MRAALTSGTMYDYNEFRPENFKRMAKNAIMANVAKQDPGRFRTRTVETEKKKRIKNRSRRKKALKEDGQEET